MKTIEEAVSKAKSGIRDGESLAVRPETSSGVADDRPASLPKAGILARLALAPFESVYANLRPDSFDLTGKTRLWKAARDSDVASLRELLAFPDRSLDRNRGTRSGDTPLALAVRTGQTGIVRELLASGADPNRPDAFGFPPLAVARSSGRNSICKLLLRHGAEDPDAGPESSAGAVRRTIRHPLDCPVCGLRSGRSGPCSDCASNAEAKAFDLADDAPPDSSVETLGAEPPFSGSRADLSEELAPSEAVRRATQALERAFPPGPARPGSPRYP